MLMLDRFYIDGAWVEPVSTTTMPVMNPAHDTRIGTLTLGNAADVDRAVAAAATAFETYSRTTGAERLALLERLLAVTRTRHRDRAGKI